MQKCLHLLTLQNPRFLRKRPPDNGYSRFFRDPCKQGKPQYQNKPPLSPIAGPARHGKALPIPHPARPGRGLCLRSAPAPDPIDRPLRRPRLHLRCRRQPHVALVERRFGIRFGNPRLCNRLPPIGQRHRGRRDVKRRAPVQL